MSCQSGGSKDIQLSHSMESVGHPGLDLLGNQRVSLAPSVETGLWCGNVTVSIAQNVEEIHTFLRCYGPRGLFFSGFCRQDSSAAL